MSQFIEMFGNPLSSIQKNELKRLGDCCQINPRRPSVSISDSDLVSFVPMPAVNEDGYIDGATNEEYGKVKKGFTYFENNDVLFAKITPCMENGKGAIAEALTNGIGMGSTEFHVLRPIEGMSNPYWLLTLTRMPIFRECAAKNMSGTGGQRRVGAAFLENFMIGLPSISEQETFETIYRQADKSEFVGCKSQFIEMFGSKKPNARIADVSSVVSGKSIAKELEDIPGDVAYVKVGDFNLPENGKYILASSRYVTSDNADSSKRIPSGTVIFAKNGAASMSNKKRLTAIECCIDMNTLAVIPNPQKLDSEFLYGILDSFDLSSCVRQGAVPSISPHAIEEIEIFIPPFEEQLSFSNLCKQADKSEYYN